jgi:hypothetical protein
MTRPLQKQRERFLVHEVGTLLGKAWDLGPDREHPDFIVTEGDDRFGLEVCEIFTGAQGATGAAMKAKESNTQRVVNDLRRRYEAITYIPLIVKFVGNICHENVAAVVPALLACDLSSKPIGCREVLDLGPALRMHVTKGFRSDWYSVNDRVGCVDRDVVPRISDAIAKKSLMLSCYSQKADTTDIRLLIVADRIHNSGKLLLDEVCILNLRGFRAVYFYSRPDPVTVFGEPGPEAT